MKRTLSLSIVTLITAFSFAQNVAINADASLPNSSAMLDVKSTSKGLLMPRVTLTGTADVSTIPSPITSLMVYNTTAAGTGATAVVAGYYYWNGAAWVRMVSSTTATYSPAKTLIPFASGGSVTLTTQANGASGNVGLVGFGNSGTTTIGSSDDINLFTGPNYSFMVPTSGTITDISGLFSAGYQPQTLPPGTTITITCQLYKSSTNFMNAFFPIAAPPVLLSPGLSGFVQTGTTGTGSASGMSIPVVAGSRLMMVVSAPVSSGSGGAGYSVPLYFSGGVNMVVQ